jgi:hypothetical protein
MSEQECAGSLNEPAVEGPGPAEREGDGDGPIEDGTALEMELGKGTDHGPVRPVGGHHPEASRRKRTVRPGDLDLTRGATAKDRLYLPIRRVFECNPLTCLRCGARVRIVAFLTDPRVIDEILRHLEAHLPEDLFHARDPPAA